jgi:hypothetical protein
MRIVFESRLISLSMKLGWPQWGGAAESSTATGAHDGHLPSLAEEFARGAERRCKSKAKEVN